MNTRQSADTAAIADTTIDSPDVRIHAIRTGSVRVRTKQIRGDGQGVRRLARTFLDREWSEWLPIYAWVIEHPEGSIVVDTGETARTSDAGYFPGWHPYYRFGVQFQVDPEDEIGPQLRDKWVRPEDVRTVIMTHLHTDHAGGLHHFPNSEILVHRSAYRAAGGLAGRVRGFLPNRWPKWFAPRLFDFESTPLGSFEERYPVTADGAISIVPTPGHTPHHVSVVVRTPQHTWFLAGDSSYTQDLMLSGDIDGLAPDDAIAETTLARIRRLMATEPVVYLPSHDPDAERRLQLCEVTSVNDSDLANIGEGRRVPQTESHAPHQMPSVGISTTRQPSGSSIVTAPRSSQ